MKKRPDINFTPPKAHTYTHTHTHMNMLTHTLYTCAHKNKEDNTGNNAWLSNLSKHENAQV